MAARNVVQMAAQFYDARDGLRGLFGERYEFVINPVRQALLTRAQEIGRPDAFMEIAIFAMKQPEMTAHDKVMILAAVADLCDACDRKAAGA